jgi:hypothetical protein
MARLECGSVKREINDEMALLRTTKCAVLLPCLPPFSILINNIQNFALGE